MFISMRHILIAAITYTGIALAIPANNFQAAAAATTTSTCSAASSVVSAISSCGGAGYCSSHLTAVTTTVTKSATATCVLKYNISIHECGTDEVHRPSTSTFTATTTLTLTSAAVSTKHSTATSVVSTSIVTKTSTKYTSTTTVTSTKTSSICYPSSTAARRRAIAATSSSTSSTCNVTYPAASITAACSCLSVFPSTVTTTTTLIPSVSNVHKTITVTSRTTLSSTTTAISTVKQTRTSTTTKTVSAVATTTAIVTYTPQGFATFSLQGSGSGSGADSLYVALSSGSTQFSSSGDAEPFVLTNNGSLLPVDSSYAEDYASAYNFEMNAVLFGSPDSSGTESILSCAVDQNTCAFTCTDDAQENYSQTEFCVNMDAESGIYYLYFGQCSYFSGENYPQIYLSVVPGQVINVLG